LNLVSDAQLGCRRWLLGLLILQSISSVVLDSYQDLLKEHIVVTFFLTMLAR
jgi:Mg/Co/Ni transporter MgtE